MVAGLPRFDPSSSRREPAIATSVQATNMLTAVKG
jgi:hypothetical protein